MAQDHNHEEEQRADLMSPGRLEGFSDGVMAIIITIMAFTIRPPSGEKWADLAQLVPQLLIYALSFTFVGIYWNNHHHLLRSTMRINGRVMWANLFLLFWLSLIPIATEWVGKNYEYSLPAAAYGVVALGAGFAFSLLVRAIIAADGEDSAAAKAVGSDLKGFVSIVLYAAAVALAFVFEPPWISYALYVGVALVWFVPDRRFSRQSTG